VGKKRTSGSCVRESSLIRPRPNVAALDLTLNSAQGGARMPDFAGSLGPLAFAGATCAREGTGMKKPRLEPFEILTANKRHNPLLAPREAEEAPEPVKVQGKAVTAAQPARSEQTSRDEDTQPASVPKRGRLLRRTQLTIPVTSFALVVVGLVLCAAAVATFVGGYRAGLAREHTPEQVPAESFDEIRRNRVVLFKDLEVDRGKLRR